MEAARHRPPPLNSGVCDQHHLAALHAGLAIAGDDVRLNDHCLSGTERFLWHGAGRAALAAEDQQYVMLYAVLRLGQVFADPANVVRRLDVDIERHIDDRWNSGQLRRELIRDMNMVIPRSSRSLIETGSDATSMTDPLMIRSDGSSPAFFIAPITQSSPSSVTSTLLMPCSHERRTSSTACTS